MPDEDHLGGTHSGDPQGHGRRHRRAAEDHDEQPRRRRRSMEDNGGGLSVADLVQRHTGSRTNLPLPPAQPPQGTNPPLPQAQPAQGTGRRALPDPAESQDPRRNRAPAPPPPGRPATRPRPGEATGGPQQQWPDQHDGAPAGPPARRPAGPMPGRPQAGPMPGGRDAAPPPASRRPGRQPSAPLPADLPGEFPLDHAAGAPTPVRRNPSGPIPGGPVPGGPIPGGPVPGAPSPGPVAGGPLPRRRPVADDLDAGPGSLPRPGADEFGPGPQRRPGPGGSGPRRRPGPDDFAPGAARHPGVEDFPAGPQRRPAPDDFGPGRPQRRPDDFGPGAPRHPGPDGPAPRRDEFPPGPPRPTGDDFPAAPRSRPGIDDFPSGPHRRPGAGPGDEFPAGPPQRPDPSLDERPGAFRVGGPEADLPPGGRESGIRRVPGQPVEADPSRAPGQGTRGAPVPLPPPRRPEEDAISLTTEMEAIGEEVQKRRSIDHTLARFSAVHDELKAEEREKKSKRRKLLPWQQDDELAELDRLDESVSMKAPIPRLDPEPEPVPGGDDGGDGGGGDDASGGRPPGDRSRNRSALAVRVVAVSAAVLVFVGTGVAWGFKSWIEANAKQVDALDPDSAAIQDAAAQRGDENFLLVGSDTRAGAAAEEGVGDENEIVGARSDTVMIAHVPENRERVVVVSFPRDLEVNRPECQRWDSKTGEYADEVDPGAQQVKINTAYQVGGPKCVTKMVQELSGLAINHFVGIDFHGFKDMVDAVQGVQVCVEEPLEDEVLGTVVPEAGKEVTLSGDQALNFVRARHVAGDPTSDYGRIKRQQRFLSSLLRKAMSTEVLLDPGKLTGFVDAFGKSTFGDNIGVEQMFVLGQSMQGIEAGRVTFVTVPTVGEANDRGNEDLRVEDTNALFQAIRNDNPLPGEAPKDGEAPPQEPNAQLASSNLLARQPAPADPKTIKVQVLNGGNETDGIARTTADALREFGYQIPWVDASPEKVDRTVIRYSKERQAQAQTLAASVPGAELVEDPAMGGALQLIIGPGFDGEVGSPAGGGGDEPAPDLPEDLSTVNAGDVSCA